MRQAAMMNARSREPSPKESTSCYELSGLAIHPDFQRYGIGTLLVQWGIDEAEKEGVPVLVTGEERGVAFYEKKLGFRRLPKSQYWIDSHGTEISREEVVGGNDAWKSANGGVSGCEVVWCPKSVIVDVDGHPKHLRKD
jgi:GNAT superfamily N-acetyltransferase